MSLSLFSILFCAVVSPTGSRPPSRNRNNEMPGDEELGFEAAVAALGKFIHQLIGFVPLSVHQYLLLHPHYLFSCSLFLTNVRL